MKTEYISWSRVNTYTKCPHRYWKERVEKAWQIPAAWLPHGTAVHTCIEAYHRSGQTLTVEELQAMFRREYVREINDLLEETPNYTVWFSSGQYRGMDDIRRRFHIGQEMVAAYVDWVEKHPDEEIWTAPDGTPGIELKIDFDFDGVRVLGYIDLILDRIRDAKTGAQPDGPDQLLLYREGLITQYDTEFRYGDYWMGKTGKPYPVRKPIDLTTLSREELVHKVHSADQGIREERFDPIPSKDNCQRCPVKKSCEFSRA